MSSSALHFLRVMWAGREGETCAADAVRFVGGPTVASAFPVTAFAAAAIGAAALGLRELLGAQTSTATVDLALAEAWNVNSIRPCGWVLPSAWHPLSGDYQAADGWVRLHMNVPAHRRAALQVLGCSADRREIERVVSTRSAGRLEDEVLKAGGCAAQMLSLEAWRAHPEGQALSGAALVEIDWADVSGAREIAPIDPNRPLNGLRVLDLTRIIAGPVATRLLAGLGANVLRIDPPGWDEPGLGPEFQLGKRSAYLDLREARARARFEDLLSGADILVHSLRPDALDRLGYSARRRQHLNERLIDVSIDAFGAGGPWRKRRGFDSLVQMSCGIAQEGMQVFGTSRPSPLPFQALDHASGYLAAAIILRGLKQRRRLGRALRARLSFARLAKLLCDAEGRRQFAAVRDQTAPAATGAKEETSWGPARRLPPPFTVAGAVVHWDLPATAFGASAPDWN